MDLTHVEDFAALPPPGGFVLSVLFLAAAVVVARRHPPALVPLWIFAFLLATAATVLWAHAQDTLRMAPLATVAGVLVRSSFSTAAAVLVLLLLTRRPGRFARLRWMIPVAVIAFVAGLLAAGSALRALGWW